MLPAFTLGLSIMAPIARMVRSTMLEILESDYIKAAWAAGIPRRRVIYGDALANALIPVITILGIVFGFLMAGNAVVESVFAWPGIGNYAITSLMTKDSGRSNHSCCSWRRSTFCGEFRHRHPVRVDRLRASGSMAGISPPPVVPLAGIVPRCARMAALRRNWLSAGAGPSSS
jgi:hypothetical protein